MYYVKDEDSGIYICRGTLSNSARDIFDATSELLVGGKAKLWKVSVNYNPNYLHGSITHHDHTF